MITVKTFSSGPIGTNTYLVLNGTGQAAIIDASHDVTETILAAAAEREQRSRRSSSLIRTGITSARLLN
ncbi:MAG: MBL fold metallo-hydrolase [Thermomicrobiales bacterium]